MAKKQTHTKIEQRRVKHAEKKTKRAKKASEKVEERLSYLIAKIANSPAVTYICEPAGDYAATFISENIKDQLGYGPDEFVEDPKFWVNHIHPRDRRRALKNLPRLFEREHYVHEYRFKHKDGSYRWMRDEFRLVRDTKGNPTEIVGYWIDITDRKQAEEALKEKEVALKAKAKELSELNKALRVLMKQRLEDKKELEQKILSNVRELVVPFIDKLKKSALDAKSMTYLRILESNLNDIVSPFVHQLSSKYSALTPKEIQVAQLIREGKNTRDIGELLNSSKRTIESHRQSIRNKLGLRDTKANLRSYLLSM
jgi:PAS domain S-box-containing protein